MKNVNVLAGSLLLAAVVAVPLSIRAADAPASATTPAPTSATAKRSVEQIMGELQDVEKSLAKEVGNGIDTLTDKTKREAAAPKVIPALKKTLPLLDELEAADNRGKVIAGQIRPEMFTLLCVFGDEATRTYLKKQAEADTPAGLTAKIALLNGDWVTKNKDEAAQAKVIDELEKLAKAKPADVQVTRAVAMVSQFGAASDANQARVDNIIEKDLTSPMAKQLQEQIASRRTMQAMVNKPLDIKGTKVDGSQFTSGDWKGKVILIDFWATWCGPCKEELPRVKAAYTKFHDKGLEVLGVSCDSDKDALQSFVKADAAMPWPQLFDKQNAELNWHPLAKSYGINGIPTMFLIDKKGVLRSVTARENFEEMIPKLLAE